MIKVKDLDFIDLDLGLSRVYNYTICRIYILFIYLLIQYQFSTIFIWRLPLLIYVCKWNKSSIIYYFRGSILYIVHEK